MKLSVVFGIIQMFAGTCLKGLNAVYFQEPLDFMFEFIPMVVFAASMFIYVSTVNFRAMAVIVLTFSLSCLYLSS